MINGDRLFDWQVKIPLVTGEGFVWVKATSWGCSEEEAFKDVVRRFMFATIVKPEGADDTKLDRPKTILCAIAYPAVKEGFCQLCGQSPADHPIYEGTLKGDACETWQNYINGMEWNGF